MKNEAHESNRHGRYDPYSCGGVEGGPRLTLYTAPRGPAVRLDGEILDVVDRSDIDIGMSSLSSAWAVGR